MRRLMKGKMIGLMITLLMVTATTVPLFAGASGQTHARSTGNEALSVDVSEVFYERGNSISVTVMSTNLDPATEYVLEWELCLAPYNSCNLYGEMAASGGSDPTETEGSIDLGSGNMFTTSIFTFTDPGLFEEDETNGLSGIRNQSYHFRVNLNTQGVELAVNQSSAFVYGGEMRSQSYIDNIGNLLKNTPIEFTGRFYLDYDNRNLLDYDLDCGLYEGTSTTPVDTYSIENMNTYQSYGFFYSTVPNGSVGEELLPLASSGVHHVECSLTRNIDGTVMGTIVSNDFNVIDADVTGLEEIHVDDLTSVFYDRSTAATSMFTVSVDFTDLYIGETYTADWELCLAPYNSCDLYGEMAASGGSDPTETEGQFSFTPTTDSSTQTFDFTDPGLFVEDETNGLSGIRNQSYHFRITLSVQGVELDLNQSTDFVLGGEMRSQSYIDNIGDLLENTPIEFTGRFYLDYDNRNLLDYDLDCGLYHGTSLTPVDTHSYENLNVYHTYYYFSSSGGNANTSTYDLIATTTGTHHVECALTRNIDGAVMGKIISNDFQIIGDTTNQDDASISVSVDMHADYQYGNITIVGSDLDAGQEYKYTWIVHDNTPIPPVSLIENDHIWVQGNDGSSEYVLEFHDLPDTNDACFSVTFYAGDTELQDVSGVCWISASTSDLDGDGVYDKNDLCDDTPANTVVQPDGCSDSDGDGFDSSYETSCGSDPNDVNSIPTDYDNDGTCDLLDTDADGDGFLNEDEILAGTLPLDDTSFPANRLPTCSLYYSLESEGMPTSFDGNAAIPALSGVTAQMGIDSIVPPVITIPEGSYYMTAHCVDLDGDDITVTVNDITIGPVAGEVSAGALVVIGENVSETVDVTITWTDGSDTLMTTVTVEMESDSTSPIPGFGLLVGLSALLMAGFVSRREHER